MKDRLVYCYWLLLLLPALALAAGGAWLLRYEADQWEERQAVADRRQAESFAQEVVSALHLAESDLLGKLTAAANEPQRLLELERHDPLVRNVFVWRPPRTLLYPDLDQPATRDQARFLARYEPLFSGRMPWRTRGEAAAASAQRAARQSSYDASAQILANRAPQQLDEPAPVASGWLPWYSDNRLHLLAWAQTADGVCGLELETMAFLGRLFPALQNGDEYGAIYQLRDGDGAVLFQSGELPESKVEPVPAATVPIGPALPHWQVALYRPPELLPGRALIMLFGALLLIIFLVAIVAGGSLLLWQTRRLRREAMQKTSFVAHVSHELKTPLTTMRMYTEMLAEGRVQDEAKRQRYLDVLVEESQRLARLVNNLLDFSRLDQGRKQYHPAEVDVAPLLLEAAARQTVRLQQAGLVLLLVLPEASVNAWLDPDAFAQVLVNLLDNAAKYAASGREVTVTLDTEAGRPTVTVADRGPGIPPAARRQLFTAFHRADDRLTGQQDGTGLGLAIARRLLRDQGGDLVYRDRPGGGAEFVLTLPTTPETAA